ncbi:MAG: molybdate ABC transporter permease subunit, partial [Mesorhizobium sp.]
MTTAPAKAGWRFRQPSVIPGFGLTLGFSLAYLTIIILIPLSGLIWRSAALGWTDFWAIVTDRRTINALEISFGTAFIAAAVNVVFGTIVAWVLVRYSFPG